VRAGSVGEHRPFGHAVRDVPAAGDRELDELERRLDPVDPLGPVKEANGRTEARITARAPYALKRKEGPDADGYERLSCPALGDHPASCARCGKARSPLGMDG